MSARLSVELWLRRHGRALPLVLLTTTVLGIASAATLWPAPAPLTVEAVDGSRQLEERHRAFRGMLVPRAELDARQRDVLGLAARHGLTLGRIDYADDNNAAGRHAVATLQMPVRGPYPEFRAFLAEVLAAHPALAIDDLAIQRDSAGSGIEARLRLAFFTEARTEARTGSHAEPRP